MILHEYLQELRQNINQMLDPHKTPHTHALVPNSRQVITWTNDYYFMYWWLDELSCWAGPGNTNIQIDLLC